ncbi:hypothetical protein EOD42_22600 [Rhodovarius crocodyli]|uniref:Phage head morphogenesis domain-containing protein n=1 Tax=Rhodovarius crocodyli TaxID=1979269 RepID=A0A437M162_9PROT|nr:hypothetical protein [Rhodovarius crocodyli]RVT91449.1 hypothetical protein EOD42_22600 [Rhodovarius crocodyli]
MTGPLLLDIGAVPEAHCNDCIEGLFKAMAVDPRGDGDASIWERHHDPFIAQHIEDVTAWMQRILQAIQDELIAYMGGKPLGALRKAADWEDMRQARLDVVRARLEAKGPAHFGIGDWMDLADLLLAEYLPEGVITSMADFMAVRAALLGKIKAAMDRSARPNPGAAAIASALPMRRRDLPPKVLTGVESAILDIAAARAAMFISDLADDTRKRIKAVLLERLQMQVLGEQGGTPEYLRSALFDEFGQLNRDWRRIAVTEIGEAHNTGFIAGQPLGAKVRRVEAYRGACDFCKSINGKTFRVVAPGDPKRNGNSDVWVGKTNARRRASSKRRDGGVMVERSPDERWWVAAGVQHPHCRGSWTYVPEAKPAGVDPAFMAWLNGELAKVAVTTAKPDPAAT